MGFKALKDVLLKTIISGAEKVFVNDNGVIKQTSINNFIVTDPEHTSNKVTTIDSTNTDTQYPSAKCVYTELQNKQNKLTPGDNITIDENNVISATGGGGDSSFVIKFTLDPDADDIAISGADKTSREITEAYNSGKYVYGILCDADGTQLYNFALSYAIDGECLFNWIGAGMGIAIMADCESASGWSVDMYNISSTQFEAGEGIEFTYEDDTIVISATGGDDNNAYVVTVTNGMSDKTPAEITAAWESGRPVYAVVGDYVYHLVRTSNQQANFSMVQHGSYLTITILTILSNKGAVIAASLVQRQLTAGEGITIDGTVISATGGSVTDPILENAIETHGLGWTDEEEKAGFDIQWDGNTEGLESQYSMYRVTDDIHDITSPNDLIGVHVTTIENGEESTFVLTEDNIATVDDDGKIVSLSDSSNPTVGLVVIEDTTMGSETIKRGFWLGCLTDDYYSFYVSRLYKEATTSETIHKIDAKYIDAAPTEVTNAIETGGIGWTEGDSTTIEWDGDTSGLVSVADSLFKVANYTAVTKEDLICCIISVQNDDNHPTPFAVEEDDIYDSTIPHAIMVSDYVLFVSEPTSYGPYNFEESGIYFAKGDDTYASSLTYTTNKTIHKIDTKYLPEKGFVKIDEDVSVQDVIDIINSGGIPYLRLSSDYDNAIMTPHRVVEYDYMQLVGFIGFGRIEGDVTHDAITQYEIYYQDVSSRDGWSRIYSSTQSCIPEAPVDGKQYARKDGDWSEVVGGSGGEGLQYDFVIVSEDGETYSFEKGSYNAIVSKIKSAPVTGIARLCLDEYMQYSTHQILNVQYVCTDPDEDTWFLGVIVFGAEGEFQLIINEDNTIVSA